MVTVQSIVDNVARDLMNVPGIVGVVLGGSRARGTHRENSDIDIGIYYDPTMGFDCIEVGKIAAKYDDEHRENLISSLGGWGPWVNAGGWLVIEGYHVDFILRDFYRVAAVLDDCLAGKLSSHYHAGHPHAYLNVMYMGEISICKIITDPMKRLADLKGKTVPYPKRLKESIIDYFMFEASFSAMLANGNVENDDISYVSGHCFRSISCLNQVLFALNEEYCINEKKAVRMITNFRNRPIGYKEKIDEIITLISSNTKSTKRAVDMLHELISETNGLIQT